MKTTKNNRPASANGAAVEQPAAKAKGRKAPAVVDEEALLAEITVAAEAYADADVTLRRRVLIAAENDVDRADVIEAIVAGGLSESYARSVVSQVYCETGRREKAPGGRATPPEAIELAESLIERFHDRKAARKTALAAYRYLGNAAAAAAE